MVETTPEAAASFLRKVRGPGVALESLTVGAATDLRTAAEQPPVTNFDRLPPQRKDAVAGALAKLDTPAAMARDERFALEAIIIPDRRPAIAIVNDDYQVSHQHWLGLNAADVRARIVPAIPAIGRLDLPSRSDIPYAGTAFLVGPGLVMTNRHVAELFVDGVGRGLTFRPGATPQMNFVEEAARAGETHCPVSSVVLIHPYWDMALLRVEDCAAAPLTLGTADPADDSEDVVVIGYPAFNPRLSRAVQDEVFEGLYNVKRLQPGRWIARRTVDSFGKTVNAATHDASTLGGNSGSAVLSPTSGQVVALHFGGAYLDTNYAVPISDLARDAQLVDAGIQFATPRPAATDGPWSGWWRGLETVPVPVAAVQAPATRTITVPLTVTVTVSQDVTATVAPALEGLVEPWHDEDYAGRTGYDPNFLGIAVPLPDPVDPAVLARLSDGTTVIPYTHFSIAMHARRRLAMFTASNVSAEPALRRPDGREYTRRDLGGLDAGDTEKWFSDPRLRGIEQLPDRFFTRDRKSFDKGHLVRRDDVAWGRSLEEMRRANGDSYHVTNCSPQVADFNQPRGRENWGDLESAVLKQATDQRLCVLAGPILADDDPLFRGEDDGGAVSVRIPRRYWKVIIAPDGAGLGAYAFLLEQDLSGVAMERVTFDAKWRRAMVPVADLEARIGQLRFADVIHRADRVATSAGLAVAEVAGA